MRDLRVWLNNNHQLKIYFNSVNNNKCLELFYRYTIAKSCATRRARNFADELAVWIANLYPSVDKPKVRKPVHNIFEFHTSVNKGKVFPWLYSWKYKIIPIKLWIRTAGMSARKYSKHNHQKSVLYDLKKCKLKCKFKFFSQIETVFFKSECV